MTTQAPSNSVQEIRERARKDVEAGAVTQNYPANREQIIKYLNDSLATEMVCVLRYRRHYFMAKGINSEPVAQEFLQHSNEEQQHADMLAERIVQLGGAPDLNPDSFTKRSHAEYVESDNLKDMIKENLVAERIAIDTYRDIIRSIGDSDPTSRRVFEEILSIEEEHADDLANFLD